MADSLDDTLHALAQATLPAGLNGLEARVWARIDAAAYTQASRPSLGLGLGAAALAMTIGIVASGVPARSEAGTLELSVFSSRAALMPSTLLATSR